MKEAEAPKVDKQVKTTRPETKRTKMVKQATVTNNAKPQGQLSNSDRYWVRILKGSALPLLYTLVSLWLLRKYVYEYTDYYDYDTMMILLGAGLGLITMTGMTLFNLYKAKTSSGKGVYLKSVTTLIVFTPILMVMVVLAMLYGISTAWQFSIGFFITSAIPPVVVILSEVVSKGKFFISEIGDQKNGRRLYLLKTPSE
jgi:hypothetical protein